MAARSLHLLVQIALAPSSLSLLILIVVFIPILGFSLFAVITVTANDGAESLGRG